MTSASEDGVASDHVIDRGSASVIESDALARCPCDRVSGYHVVLCDIRAVPDNHSPAVAVEMIAGDRISLTPDDVHSVVRAGEDGVAGDGFSPSVA